MRIDHFKLSSAGTTGRNAEMIRGDQNYVLYGKLTNNERDSAIGHYIGVRRKKSNKPAVVKLEYQLSNTGSQKHSNSHSFLKNESYHEFKFLGSSYLKSQRIVTWKISLLENGIVVDSQHSYLWEN